MAADAPGIEAYECISKMMSFPWSSIGGVSAFSRIVIASYWQSALTELQEGYEI